MVQAQRDSGGRAPPRLLGLVGAELAGAGVSRLRLILVRPAPTPPAPLRRAPQAPAGAALTARTLARRARRFSQSRGRHSYLTRFRAPRPAPRAPAPRAPRPGVAPSADAGACGLRAAARGGRRCVRAGGAARRGWDARGRPAPRGGAILGGRASRARPQRLRATRGRRGVRGAWAHDRPAQHPAPLCHSARGRRRGSGRRRRASAAVARIHARSLRLPRLGVCVCCGGARACRAARPRRGRPYGARALGHTCVRGARVNLAGRVGRARGRARVARCLACGVARALAVATLRERRGRVACVPRRGAQRGACARAAAPVPGRRRQRAVRHRRVRWVGGGGAAPRSARRGGPAARGLARAGGLSCGRP